MPFKPFAHLARVSFAKGITHSYASSAVAAPTTLGQFHNHSVAKFTKASHGLQSSFTTASGSSGAGAKAGHATQSTGGDGGLAQYYAAWQHAQQTGDDTDWRQHQYARRVGWKHSDKKEAAEHPLNRLGSSKAVDSLRSSSTSRTVPARSHSEGAVFDVKDGDAALAEAEALALVDQAVANEIRDINASKQAAVELDDADEVEDVGTPLMSTRVASPAIGHLSSAEESATSSHTVSSPSDATWSSIVEEDALSADIVKLGQQHRYSEIPAVFENIVREGLVPSVDAYNHILLSAIHLNNGYQPYPRALEIYGDMTKRAVQLNDATYGILLQYLTSRALEVQSVQKELDQRALRYRTRSQPFLFSSTAHRQQLFADDISLAFANKLYNIARATLKNFTPSTAVYNTMVRACAQAGDIEQMSTLLADMDANGVQLSPSHYITVIDAYGAGQDSEAAQKVYQGYRDLAIARGANDPLDMQVYAALVKAYHSAGQAATGLHFYEKVQDSFKSAEHGHLLADALTTALVLNGLLAYHIGNKAFAQALQELSQYPLQPVVRAQALAKICIAAADANKVTEALQAYTQLPVAAKGESALALSAMYLRAKDVPSAKAMWKDAQSLPVQVTTDFAAAYGTALIRTGAIEEGIVEGREIFQRVRSSAASEAAHEQAMAEIDEAILLFGETLIKEKAVVSPQASISLLRAMIENGGLMSPVTEDAIASLGPECIQQLNAQDIALALHVQAQMLPSDGASGPDIAHMPRFCHLLDTVLSRGILMDPSTVNIVSEAVPKIAEARPDLATKWQDFMTPKPVAPQPRTPVTPQVSFTEQSPVVDTFDPYAHTTDFRASKVISDTLENQSGRFENHLNDALSRFRNVRRAGRHLHYAAYGKLITAAGKAKQPRLISEMLNMASADVPLALDVPSVRNGWVGIFDAAIAAYLTLGDRQLAGKYHRQLTDMGAAPSANTFGIYITTLEGTFDEATEAVKIFQRAVAEGVAPSVFLYNAVIGKLGKARRIDDCLRYFGEMQNQGMRPSSVTYGTLVNALCRTSEESFAVEMFDEMEAAPNYRPRPAPYNSLIQYFLNTKRDRSKVLQYYERMKTRGIKPTSHTYKLLIESYASLEPVNLTAAEAILAEMKSNGVEPESVHYGTLIHAKGCVMHDMAAARSTFDSVIKNPSIRATDNLYQNLLEAMVANHEVASTAEILDDMSRRGVRMTPYIANTLIHGWATEKDIVKAKSIYDSLGMDKREPSTYEAMTRAFLAAEDHAGANGVVQEMLRKGYPAAVSEKVLALVGGAA